MARSRLLLVSLGPTIPKGNCCTARVGGGGGVGGDGVVEAEMLAVTELLFVVVVLTVIVLLSLVLSLTVLAGEREGGTEGGPGIRM